MSTSLKNRFCGSKHRLATFATTMGMLCSDQVREMFAFCKQSLAPRVCGGWGAAMLKLLVFVASAGAAYRNSASKGYANSYQRFEVAERKKQWFCVEDKQKNNPQRWF